MEDSAKKAVMIVVVIVCLAAAGVIAYKFRPGRAPTVQGGTMMWVKCNKEGCGYEYQIDEKDYFGFILKKGGASVVRSGIPALKCPKCGEESVYKAIKCEKCGKVFFPGSVEGPFNDKCPGCGFSKKEAAQKQAAGGGAKS